jgi:hypothetical protein
MVRYFIAAVQFAGVFEFQNSASAEEPEVFSSLPGTYILKVPIYKLQLHGGDAPTNKVGVGKGILA